MQRGDSRLVRAPAIALADDVNLQRWQREFGGHIGSGKQSLAPASYPLVESIKQTMQAYSKRSPGLHRGERHGRQPYSRYSQALSQGLERPGLLDPVVQQDANCDRVNRFACHRERIDLGVSL